jgi:hypothetical protein
VEQVGEMGKVREGDREDGEGKGEGNVFSV